MKANKHLKGAGLLSAFIAVVLLLSIGPAAQAITTYKTVVTVGWNQASAAVISLVDVNANTPAKLLLPVRYRDLIQLDNKGTIGKHTIIRLNFQKPFGLIQLVSNQSLTVVSSDTLFGIAEQTADPKVTLAISSDNSDHAYFSNGKDTKLRTVKREELTEQPSPYAQDSNYALLALHDHMLAWEQRPVSAKKAEEQEFIHYLFARTQPKEPKQREQPKPKGAGEAEEIAPLNSQKQPPSPNPNDATKVTASTQGKTPTEIPPPAGTVPVDPVDTPSSARSRKRTRVEAPPPEKEVLSEAKQVDQTAGITQAINNLDIVDATTRHHASKLYPDFDSSQPTDVAEQALFEKLSGPTLTPEQITLADAELHNWLIHVMPDTLYTFGPEITIDTVAWREGQIYRICRDLKHAQTDTTVKMVLSIANNRSQLKALQSGERIFSASHYTGHTTRPPVVPANTYNGKTMQLILQTVDDQQYPPLSRNSSPLPVRQALAYIRAVAAALADLSTYTLLPQTLSPEEIVVSTNQPYGRSSVTTPGQRTAVLLSPPYTPDPKQLEKDIRATITSFIELYVWLRTGQVGEWNQLGDKGTNKTKKQSSLTKEPTLPPKPTAHAYSDWEQLEGVASLKPEITLTNRLYGIKADWNYASQIEQIIAELETDDRGAEITGTTIAGFPPAHINQPEPPPEVEAVHPPLIHNLTCNNGHPLQLTDSQQIRAKYLPTNYSGRIGCNGAQCNKNTDTPEITGNAPIFHCDICQYDICQSGAAWEAGIIGFPPEVTCPDGHTLQLISGKQKRKLGTKRKPRKKGVREYEPTPPELYTLCDGDGCREYAHPCLDHVHHYACLDCYQNKRSHTNDRTKGYDLCLGCATWTTVKKTEITLDGQTFRYAIGRSGDKPCQGCQETIANNTGKFRAETGKEVSHMCLSCGLNLMGWQIAGQSHHNPTK